MSVGLFQNGRDVRQQCAARIGHLKQTFISVDELTQILNDNFDTKNILCHYRSTGLITNGHLQAVVRCLVTRLLSIMTR